jgi:hypothetical protein
MNRQDAKDAKEFESKAMLGLRFLASMASWRFKFFFCLTVLAVLPGLARLALAEPIGPRSLWDGGATVPVHRFPIFDEDGQVVVPTLPGSMPMSTRYTCGACHDYKTVAGGFHFNAGVAGAKPGRPGEPWAWVDRDTGTALPISDRGWAGTWTTKQLGISAWRFARLFGRNLPGGGMVEPQDLMVDAKARWMTSGAIQIDCLACHSQSAEQDLSERAKQMARENFRWAATAASGLGQVAGMASRLPGSWHPGVPGDPDDPFYAVPPSVDYDKTKYDATGRFLFDVGRPKDANCLQCHSTASLDSPRWSHSRDVHSEAGIACVDCHHNDLGHAIIRGYEGEAAARRGGSRVAEFSCAGCHLGQGSGAPLAGQGGRMAAPRPFHKGLPPSHLEKLSCTACHSGALPVEDREPALVRASRANRLGIQGRADWTTDDPRIVETVYIKGKNGKIEPSRLMWPSFWVKFSPGVGSQHSFMPLTPDFMMPYAAGILDAPAQGRAVLALLAQDPNLDGEPVLGVNGKWLAIDPNDQLKIADAKISETFMGTRWSLAKDGRVGPLYPDFDVKAETLDDAVAQVLRETLQVLAAWSSDGGQPVLIYKGTLFRRDPSGRLQREAAPKENAPENAVTTLSVVLKNGGSKNRAASKAAPSAVNSNANSNANANDAAGAAPRLAWRGKDGKPRPLVSDFIAESIAQVVGTGHAFTEAQVAAVLARLQAGDKKASFGYIGAGKLFRLAADGKTLDAIDDPLAKPYAWPLAHSVRPAAQALGAKGCMDCHAAFSPFFAATMTGQGAIKTERAAKLTMAGLEGVDAHYEGLIGLSLVARSAFEIFGWTACGALALILTVFAIGGLGRLARWLGGRS